MADKTYDIANAGFNRSLGGVPSLTFNLVERIGDASLAPAAPGSMPLTGPYTPITITSPSADWMSAAASDGYEVVATFNVQKKAAATPAPAAS